MRRQMLIGCWLLLLVAAFVVGLARLPEAGSYWPAIGRYAWRRLTFRDARFPWQERVNRTVRRWEMEVLPKLTDPRQQANALSAAAYTLSFPELAAGGADPVLTLASARYGLFFETSPGDVRRWDAKAASWLSAARQLAPADLPLLWQEQLHGLRTPGFERDGGGLERVVEEGRRRDPDNAFWCYLLAAIAWQRQEARFRPRVLAMGQAAAVLPFDLLASRRTSLMAAFRAAKMGIWSRTHDPRLRVPPPTVSADCLEWARQGSARSAYCDPRSELNRRIQSAAKTLGLSGPARRKLEEYLAAEFRGAKEFDPLTRVGPGSPGYLYWCCEAQWLQDALIMGDAPAARESYGRLLRLFEQLWDAYPSTAERTWLAERLLLPLAGLLSDPAVTQTGCLSIAYANEVTQKYLPFAEEVGLKQQWLFGYGTNPLVAGTSGPTAAQVGWLVVFDSSARSGLALLLTCGLALGGIWLFRWRLRAIPRHGRSQKPGASSGASRPGLVPLAGIAAATFVLAAAELSQMWAREGPGAATHAADLGVLLFVVYGLLWTSATTLVATARSAAGAPAQRNVGVLIFVGALLGLWFGLRQLGDINRDGYAEAHWPSLAQLLLNPMDLGEEETVLEGREIATLLLGPTVAATVLALHWLYQRVRRRSRGSDTRNNLAPDPASPEGHKAPGLPSKDEGRPARWKLHAAIGSSLILWLAIVVAARVGEVAVLAARLPEEAWLYARLRSEQGLSYSPANLPYGLAVSLALRLRSAWGFWQFPVACIGLTALVFTLVRAPSTSEWPSWTARFNYWPAGRLAALGRCLTATCIWLAVGGATLHVTAFLAAAYLLHLIA